MCYWQWVIEISTVLVHSGASSSCIWTSYYMQCQRFLLFVWALIQQGLSTELCKDVIASCVILLIILATFIVHSYVRYISTSSNNKHAYCATLHYVWHHFVHNTSQWSTYAQSLFARRVLRHFTYWHWFSFISCVSCPKNYSDLLALHPLSMHEAPTSSWFISFFFNVFLYLYTPFDLELSSSFRISQ